MMNKNRLWIALTVLAMAALACSVGNVATATPTPANTPTAAAVDDSNHAGAVEPTAAGTPDTQFPLPENVSNFTKMTDAMINFQTKVSLKDLLKFYKEEMTKAGYTERTLLTVTSDTTFSMVFDGYKGGKVVVVQGVDLGGGSANISIRVDSTP